MDCWGDNTCTSVTWLRAEKDALCFNYKNKSIYRLFVRPWRKRTSFTPAKLNNNSNLHSTFMTPPN